MRRLCVISLSLLISCFLRAQAPPPPPQTARQALIEMFFGQAANHLEKHLPEVTRRSFQKLDTGNGQSLLSQLSMFAAEAKAGGAGFETFETGPSLLTAEDPRGTSGEKVEITVERDDLVGDEDQIELALHLPRNEKKEEALPFIPRLTFSMKMESDVWRLNEISVTVRLPLADPDFLKNIEDRQRSQNEQITIWSVRTVTTAEKSYSVAHGGYACTQSALANTGKTAGGNLYLYDSQLASGKKNGYIYVISECDASHYKIVAEPAVEDSGQWAFCSDESGMIRASADGKATTCLSHGEPVQDATRAAGLGAIAQDGRSTPREPSERATQTVVMHSVGPSDAVPQRVRVSQGVSQSLVVSKVQPVYPPEAKAARVQGSVVMSVSIAKTGDVEKVDVLSGDPLLAPAAANAVRQWKYKPYLLNGNAVVVDTQVTVNFTLSGQ